MMSVSFGSSGFSDSSTQSSKVPAGTFAVAVTERISNVEVERLRQIVVGPGLETGDDVVGVAAGGDHDDWHVGRASDRATHLETVHARKHDVDQHDLGTFDPKDLERVLTVGRLEHAPPLVFERQFDDGAYRVVVLDREYSCFHHAIVPDAAASAG